MISSGTLTQEALRMARDQNAPRSRRSVRRPAMQRRLVWTGPARVPSDVAVEWH